MNIFKIIPKNKEDITWLIGNLCDFVPHRGMYFVHTNLTARMIKRKIEAEGFEVEIIPIDRVSADLCPEIVEVWAINDASKKALDYVKNNREEINDKVLRYIVESIENILADIKEMKGD